MKKGMQKGAEGQWSGQNNNRPLSSLLSLSFQRRCSQRHRCPQRCGRERAGRVEIRGSAGRGRPWQCSVAMASVTQCLDKTFIRQIESEDTCAVVLRLYRYAFIFVCIVYGRSEGERERKRERERRREKRGAREPWLTKSFPSFISLSPLSPLSISADHRRLHSDSSKCKHTVPPPWCLNPTESSERERERDVSTTLEFLQIVSFLSIPSSFSKVLLSLALRALSLSPSLFGALPLPLPLPRYRQRTGASLWIPSRPSAFPVLSQLSSLVPPSLFSLLSISLFVSSIGR